MAELKIGVRLDALSKQKMSATSLRRTLSWVAASGATSVELCGHQLLNVSELSDTAVRTLRKILDDLNLQVASIRFPTRYGFDHLPDLDRRIDATKDAMRAAYRLGAPLVVNQIGPVPTPPKDARQRSTAAGASGAGTQSSLSSSLLGSAMPPEGLSVAEAQAWVAGSQASGSAGGQGADGGGSSPTPSTPVDPRWDTMREVLDDLGRFGARVGAFFAAETGTEPGEHLARLIDTSAESYIAVALNPGQLIINRHSVSGAIAALGDRIRIVNAVDGVLDLSAGRGVAVPLGQGTADFPSLLGQLEDIPYRGPFVVGRSDMAAATAPQEIAASVDYLRNM
ncbi:sugar phosphate isomerase/epimerase family protein [Allorhodopirellula solitaria]|uniref:Xylose isomerase-like TIM barrel n=1 Tax=Allorhodopirellula solitaria TaxID=2527987 RepID=A0A5C5WYV4_9BACT|nr:sugar phosphate isomerase/epimerase family protein [Allorhodopirellula solitaria]TWT55887.1 Xylose isomerase-like TIM barrel [Allorhodopirellula solitaria]